MTGKTDQLLNECQHPTQCRRVWVKADLPHTAWDDLIVLPPDTVFSEALDLILRQVESAPNVAHRTA